jgi:two-component system, cell cycle response regulator DivK
MVCPRCRAENREGRRFCGECGLSFASSCPSCGFLNEGSEKFCGGCGKSLTATAGPVEPRFSSPPAETGEEGVRLAQERHPSLVLMDIRLPGIDGIEALRRLRAEDATREIPIMAMTASVMTADRRKITDAGFDAFQSKPLKVSDFVAAVEPLLDHPGK